ncbi:MAG: extracellular solute-binding protein [Clostridiales bacterium]|nr:extracellular solute-binding protein [Clostridiales bacterium]
MLPIEKMIKAALALTTICVATACGGARGQTGSVPSLGAGDERAHVRLWASVGNIALTNEVVTSFNASSEAMLVDVQYIPESEYDGKIAVELFSSSQSFDCFYLRRPSQVNRFAPLGLLADLTPYISTSELDLANYGATLDTTRLSDDSVYSLPQIRSAYLLFYNKAIFRKNGLEYPGPMTWGQYQRLALQLTSGSGLNKTWGGYIGINIPLNLGASVAGEYLTDDGLSATRDYIRLLGQMHQEGSHPNTHEMESLYNNYYELFEKGNIAMMINGDWAISEILRDTRVRYKNLDWDIAPLPVPERVDGGTTVGNCSYLGISAKSENIENAFLFISYFCGKPGAAIMAKYAAYPAYYTSEAAKAYLTQAEVPGARYFFNSYILNEEAPHPLYDELDAAFRQSVAGFLYGRNDLNGAFEMYEKDRMAILAK